MRDAWEELNSVGKVPVPDDPKPVVRPVVTPEAINEESVPLAIPVEEPEEIVPTAVMAAAPIKTKSEPANFPTNEVTLSYYGKNIDIQYDREFVTNVQTPVDNNVIADYWELMMPTNHYHLINQLQELKTSMNLNDWGYYELVRETSAKICGADQNAAKLLTWFLMMKSNYQAKIGFSPRGAHLLLPFNNQVYAKPYFNIDGQRFYVLEKVDRLSTYREDYKVATEKISLDINTPLHIGAVTEERKLKFEHLGKTYELTVKYSLNDIAFYKSYPQADVEVYFDAAVSDQARESLLSAVKPLISGMSEVDAVNLLLSLVQKSFDYKTDPEQFGQEKFFFAEEIFFYPYSDCEDRAVLFAYLTRELLGLKVIGLRYPGHMATAVAFTENVDLHHLFYNNIKYTVCDPTYIGASVGMCMPQFISERGIVVPLR